MGVLDLSLYSLNSRKVFLSLFGIFAFTFLLPTSLGNAAASNTQQTVVAQTTTKTDKKAKQVNAKRTTTSVTYNGWVVRCVTKDAKAKEKCTARFTVINKKSKKTLLLWLVGYNKKNVLMTELLTPNNVLIEPGVELLIDKKLPVKTLYHSCGPRGCWSRLVMSKKLRARLAKAKTVSVKVATRNGKIINFNIGFKGFAKALKDIAR